MMKKKPRLFVQCDRTVYVAGSYLTGRLVIKAPQEYKITGISAYVLGTEGFLFNFLFL